MSEFFEAFSIAWDSVMSIPIFCFLLTFCIISFSITIFFRFLLSIFEIRCFPSLGIWSWIKNKFIDLLARILPGETLYKMGLARLGVDYVECEVQDCAICPFKDTCTSDLKKIPFPCLDPDDQSDLP